MPRIRLSLLLFLSLSIIGIPERLLAQSNILQWDCVQNKTSHLWNCTPGNTTNYQQSIIGKPQETQSSAHKISHQAPLPEKPKAATPINRLKELSCDPNLTQTTRRSTSSTNKPIQISADEVEGDPKQEYRLRGNIKINWNDKQLLAQKARYQVPENNIQVDGELHYQDNAIQLDGYDGEINTLTRQGTVQSADYQFRQTQGRGHASTLHLTGPETMTLNQASYTTCALGSDHWFIKASEVELDQSTGEGKAKHVRVEFMGIPFMYTPYMSFPIDNQRKSGFLTPSWGSSSQSGADIRMPYYWNIAANHDATITPRLLGKRGVQLQGEFRYLNPANNGNLALEYLPNDAITKQNRSLFSWQHQGRIGTRISTLAELNTVSDKHYFEDLGNSPNASSKTHLEQTLAATLHGDHWTLNGRLQNYQRLSSTSVDSYRRLPQIEFITHNIRTDSGLEYKIQTDLTHFYKKGSLSGNRLILKPSLQYPMQGSYWFVKPSIALHSRYYQLSNTNPGDADKLQFNIPTISIDSGIFLERHLKIQQQSLIHSIEPRLFYTRTPRRNQEQAPIFDSALLNINQPWLFANNRFSGNDRIADANQITLALGSRLRHSATGQQLLHLNIGQILYFADREVTLPNQAIETRKTSNIITELDVRLSSIWRLDSRLYWNPDNAQTEQVDVRLQYTPNERRLLNLAYRYQAQEFDQLDASMVWPIHSNWHAVTRWNYSLRDKHLIEGLIGLEYSSCCWGLQFFVRNYINDGVGKNSTAFYLQLELKGLGNIGQSFKSQLEKNILGYR